MQPRSILLEEARLIKLARAGDKEAAHELLTSPGVLEPVQTIAYQYYLAYQWAQPSLDWQDLFQDAYEQMIRLLDQALSENNPVGYLIGIARLWIHGISYRGTYNSNDQRVPMPDSLDAPLPRCEGMTLHDVIADRKPLSPYAEETIFHEHLHQAVSQLPGTQQTVIVRRYGIGEHAPEEFAQIAEAVSIKETKAQADHIRALGALYFALGKSYPTYVQGNMELLEYKRGTQTLSIPDRLRKRLDKAYDAILARGEKIGIERLRQESHVGTNRVACYLRERKGTQPSRQQRLDDAYARLLARGQKISGDALMREAHVNKKLVVLYLRKREADLAMQEVQA